MKADASVEAYLATLPADKREALARLRGQVTRLVPDAVESISYGMPTFKVGNRALLWYAAWQAHCSIYPLTDSFLAAHADELKGYRRTRGSLHFKADAPLPEPLLEELVKARLVDIESGT